jgi:hypothetical protein
MNYVKPGLEVFPSAIETIQSSTLKSTQSVYDFNQNVKPVALATTIAYEADE